MSQNLAYYKEICSERTLQSNSKGFFMNFVDFVTEEVGENWIKYEFGKMKSDEDRVRFVFQSEKTKNILINFLSNVQEVYRGKDAEFSRKRRIEGEKLLSLNQIDKALILFSQSVLRSPKKDTNKNIDSGLTLSLSLFARSQALMQKQKYLLALADLHLAIKESLPDEFKAQAYNRIGICYKALGNDHKSKIALNVSKKLGESYKETSNDLNWMRNLDCGECSTQTMKITPTVAGKPNSALPSASVKLKVETAKGMGRYIVANEKICTGDTLVVEEPYAACLLPECFGTHCHNCFNRLESAIGCADCSGVAFCSTDCRDQAAGTYHKYECKYLNLLIGSGMSILAHTALRMVTQNNLEKCLEIYKNRGKEKIYSLCSNVHQRPTSDFFQRTLMACFLLRCLQKSKFTEKTDDTIIPTDEEYQIAAMLLFNLQMLQFNAHEIYETVHNSEHRIKNSKAAYIGVAVYLTASLFNHDCSLALTRYFVGKKIVLQALRPFKPNEIVPENYGPVFTRKPLSARQMSLAGRYWFQCRCKACLQDWPGYQTGLEKVTTRLRCPTESCINLFPVPSSSSKIKCPKCQKNVDLSKAMDTLKWCQDQYYLAFETMEEEDVSKSCQILCKAIDTFYEVSAPPHKETQLAEEMLRACVADTGNTTLQTSA